MSSHDLGASTAALDLVVARETVAKNVAASRAAQGMSQDDLATAAEVSRATIIQIESGESDSMLSTLVKVATALEVSPMFLLLGKAELDALADVVRGNMVQRLSQAVGEESAETMRRLLQSGLTRNRNRAVKMGASAVATAGLAAGAITGAAIGSILLPGLGTAIGGALGSLFGATRSGGAGTDDDD